MCDTAQHNTPADKAVTQALVESMFPILHTFWGGFWETLVRPDSEVNGVCVHMHRGLR